MMRLLKIVTVVALVAAVAVFAVSQAAALAESDSTIPVISAESETLEIPCAYTQEQLLAGVTASDAKDGDLTGQILVGDFSRFIDPGICDLTYVVFDSAEHMATLTRRVTFTDYHSPRFALAQPLCFEAGATNHTDVRAMFTASDLLDGDLTDWISYVETDASYSQPGDYTITMEVRNSFGDTVSHAFPIHVVEEGSQQIDIVLQQGLVYVMQGERFSATSYVDSITDAAGHEYSVRQLETTGQVDTDTAGLYEVHYELLLEDEETGETRYGQNWLTVIVQEGVA